MNHEKTASMVKMALLTAVIVVLTATPLGYKASRGFIF